MPVTTGQPMSFYFYTLNKSDCVGGWMHAGQYGRAHRRLLDNSGHVGAGLHRPSTTNKNEFFEKYTTAATSDLDFVPGLDKVLDAKTGRFGRCTWGLALLFCLSACLLQISERITFFQRSSITSNVRMEAEKFPRFPYLTICPDASYIVQSLLRNQSSSANGSDEAASSHASKTQWFCDVLESQQVSSLEQVWEAAAKTLDDINVKKKGPFDVDWIPIQIIQRKWRFGMGMCYTVVPSWNPDDQSVAELLIDLIGPKLPDNYSLLHEVPYFRVMVHEEPTCQQADFHFMSESVHFDIEYLLQLDASRFINLDRSHSPCVDEQKFINCREKCLMRTLEGQQLQCRLPFHPDIGSPAPCATAATCRTTYRSILQAYMLSNWTACGCVRKCKETLYTSAITSRSNLRPSGRPYSQLLVRFQPSGIRVVEEVVAYNVASLLCDVGGTLGLSMGLCCLTLLEMVHALGAKLKKALF